MLKQNNTFFGIALGAFIPVIALALLMMMNDTMVANKFTVGRTVGFYFQDKTIFVMAVCANLIPFNWYKKYYFDKTASGIVVPTLAYVALFFVWFIFFKEFVLKSWGS